MIDFSDKVYGSGKVPNHHGVLVQLKPLGSDKREHKRFACTKADGPRPALEDCYSAAILWVKERVGVPAAPAEQLGPRAATTQELEWLHQWVDKQLAPEALTLEMCDAALEHMRAAAAGSCGFVRIQEAQLLRAQLAAVERAMQRGAALHERLSAKVNVAAQPKRPRLDVPPHPRELESPPRPPPPNWARFSSYTKSTYQKLETEEHDRRAINIDREQLEHDLPAGDDTRGWHNHWRRGVFGTLRGWAAGLLSRAITPACCTHPSPASA